MSVKDVREELEVGQVYTCEQLRSFIAYNQVGSVIFSRDKLLCKDNPEAKFTVDEILEGYISKRRNDYKNHFDSKQKVYIVSRVD